MASNLFHELISRPARVRPKHGCFDCRWSYTVDANLLSCHLFGRSLGEADDLLSR